MMGCVGLCCEHGCDVIVEEDKNGVEPLRREGPELLSRRLIVMSPKKTKRQVLCVVPSLEIVRNFKIQKTKGRAVTPGW